MTYSAIGAIGAKKKGHHLGLALHRAPARPVRPARHHDRNRHALAAGFDRAFLVAAAIAVLTLVVAITTIRLRRADLAGD
jgi:hypothetical protein